MKWMTEDARQEEESFAHEMYPAPSDFRRQLGLLRVRAPKLLDELSADLASSETLASYDALSEAVAARTDGVIDTDLVCTLVCAQALVVDPSGETWNKVRRIACNSGEIEGSLGGAMRALEEESSAAAGAYVALAKALVALMEAGRVVGGSAQAREEREDALNLWRGARFPLETLFDGLVDANPMLYDMEMLVFRVVSMTHPHELAGLLIDVRDPFVLSAAMFGADVWGFEPRFDRWNLLAAAAPVALDAQGKWTGAPLLPLLLSHAYRELVASSRVVPKNELREADAADRTRQLSELIDRVVDVVASRADAMPVLARWSTWIMREMLRRRGDELSDIRSDNFVESALIKAIGRKLDGSSLPLCAPSEADAWESWCYRCVLAWCAHDGSLDVPDFVSFISEWSLTPEDWEGEKGRALIRRAKLHVLSDDLPSMSAQLLAFPLAQSSSFAVTWNDLWARAYPLLEITEFGGSEQVDKAYSDRLDASRLLLLLGSMGLACFDQAASRLAHGDVRLEIQRLYDVLESATLQALFVDNTFNRSKWLHLLQNLALRRLYWDVELVPDDRAAIFIEAAEGKVGTCIHQLQEDPGSLTNFLFSCRRHGIAEAGLIAELRHAGVDIQERVLLLEKLHALNAHRYPLNRAAAEFARSLS